MITGTETKIGSVSHFTRILLKNIKSRHTILSSSTYGTMSQTPENYVQSQFSPAAPGMPVIMCGLNRMRQICALFITFAPLWAQPPRPPESPADRNPFAGQPDAVAAGRKLFATSCSACHGANGEGGRGPNLTTGREVRRLNDRGLFNAIRSGVPGTDMPPTKLPDDDTWRLAAFVRNLSAPASESKLPGDPDAGAAVFFGKGGCSGCHMIHGRGGFLGPDLTDAGALHTVPQLREALLKPSARIADGYQAVTATTLDGAKISGVARNNDDYSIQILDSKGDLHLLSKSNLRDVLFQKNSLMPEDYARRLTPEELTNVLAFVGRQSVRPPGERAMEPRGRRDRR
jgi:cytochrome c oxidase cbb3-type subunit 3